MNIEAFVVNKHRDNIESETKLNNNKIKSNKIKEEYDFCDESITKEEIIISGKNLSDKFPDDNLFDISNEQNNKISDNQLANRININSIIENSIIEIGQNKTNESEKFVVLKKIKNECSKLKNEIVTNDSIKDLNNNKKDFITQRDEIR